MSIFANAALAAWPLLVVTLFAAFKPRKAIVVAFVVGWLFLPEIQIKLPGLPDYGKLPATSMGTLAAALIFDSGRMLRFRPCWADATWILWLLCPLASSYYNQLGLYDGCAAVWQQTMTWGAPILLGRVYFGRSKDLRDLALGIVIGAIVYVPLCLLEIAVSPQLHRWVYGFHQAAFAHAYRYGGWRPRVFMQSGLPLSVWMASAAVICLAFWKTRPSERALNFPMSACSPLLALMTLLCKAATGIIALSLGSLTFFSSWGWRTKIPLLVLVVIPSSYVALRATNILTREAITSRLRAIDNQRANSFDARLKQEDLFCERARLRPLFGWGGWMRGWPLNKWGYYAVTAVDGAWTIHVSSKGFVGLAAFLGVLAVGPLMLIIKTPKRRWSREENVPALVIATLVAIYGMDSMANDMLQPLYEIGIGGLISFSLLQGKDGGKPRRVAMGSVVARQSPTQTGRHPEKERISPTASVGR